MDRITVLKEEAVREGIQLSAALIGSLGFSMFFNVRGKILIWTSLGGFLSWGVYLAARVVCQKEYVSFFAASVAVTIFAECMARREKAPVTVFLVAALIPLIPGGSLYHTMRDAVNRDWEQFAKDGGETFLYALSIAVGIICATVMMQMLRSVLKYEKKQSEGRIP